MARRNLPPDVTLRDISATLINPEEFVRRVMATIVSERRVSGGDLVVRIGRVGTGKLPNYRLETTAGEPVVAYDGNGHHPWKPHEEFRAPGNWSSKAWTYDDVAALRQELRKR